MAVSTDPSPESEPASMTSPVPEGSWPGGALDAPPDPWGADVLAFAVYGVALAEDGLEST